MARVDIAYVLNALQTEIRAILVVARDSERIVWSYDLLGRTGGAVADLRLPAAPQAPRSSDGLVRLRDDREGAKPKGEIGNRG